MNNMQEFHSIYRLTLEPGDVVVSMTTYQDTVIICTRHGHIHTMSDAQPPVSQYFGPR